MFAAISGRNSFSNSNWFSLYIDDDSGRLRSTVYPEVDSLYFNEFKNNNALNLFEDVGEENLVGVSSIKIVKRDPIPGVRERYGVGGVYKWTPGIEVIDRDVNKYIEFLRNNSDVDENYIESVIKRHKEKIDDLEKKIPNLPLIRVRLIDKEDSKTHDENLRVIAHEVGHHLDRMGKNPEFNLYEPEAEAMEEYVTGRWTNRKKRTDKEKDIGRINIEDAVGLQSAKVLDFDEAIKYAEIEEQDGV